MNANNEEVDMGDLLDNYEVDEGFGNLTQLLIPEDFVIQGEKHENFLSDLMENSFEDETGSQASAVAQFVDLGLPELSVYGNKHHMWFKRFCFRKDLFK